MFEKTTFHLVKDDITSFQAYIENPMERENKEDEIKVETIQGISFSDINIFDKTKTVSI